MRWETICNSHRIVGQNKLTPKKLYLVHGQLIMTTIDWVFFFRLGVYLGALLLYRLSVTIVSDVYLQSNSFFLSCWFSQELKMASNVQRETAGPIQTGN